MADRLGMTGARVGRGDGLVGAEIAKYGGMNVIAGKPMTRGSWKPTRSRAREQRWPLASASLRAKKPTAQPLSETPFYSRPGDRGAGNATQAGRYASMRRRIIGKAAVPVAKLDTTMDRANADRLVRRYGAVGSLPKDLPRPERMRAYEARYVAAGGPKGERWQRRKDVSEGVRNASLGTATLTAGAMVGRGTRPARALARTKPLRRVRARHLERAAWGTAATGGAAELYGEYADSKRRSNASAPAGVAASALRRMRAYTPEDS